MINTISSTPSVINQTGMLVAKRSIKYCLLFAGLNLFSSAQCQSLPSSSLRDSSIYMLNDKPVQLIRHQYGEPHIHFLALHDSEKTGLRAAFKFMGIYGGSVVELKYGLVRNIDFLDSLKEFSFDPNRIFTDEGAYLGLARYSEPLIHDGLTEKVRKLGEEVLKFMNADRLSVIIALHNNYNGGFNIHSYKQGNYLENIAEEIFINPDMDSDNFIYVTDRRFFDYLKQRKVNVILQSRDAPDDGSLSVFAMQRQIPYANIEVQHGNLSENYRLILLVNEMIKQIPLPEQPALTRNQ